MAAPIAWADWAKGWRTTCRNSPAKKRAPWCWVICCAADRPRTFDRLIALRFGAAAVRALAEGQSGVMVALDPPTVRYVPLKKVAGRMKTVPLDCDTILTGRELGICFGD